MRPSDLSADQLIETLKAKGYVIFENDTQEYNLNIIGIRAISREPNSFDDLFVVMWKYSGSWYFHVHTGTTDPGTYWLEHPLNKLGTAILKPGQYRGCWQLGLHQGKYDALTQRKKVTVLRDDDKDKELDFDTAKEETGFFGINQHRANSKWESVQVDKWSAGCQVRNDPDEYDDFIYWCKQAEKLYGNSFTYTLIEEKDLI